MAKIRQLPNNIWFLDFSTPHENFDWYWKTFLNSDLGRLYEAIPWDALVRSLRGRRRTKSGRKSIFDTQGKLALMFLKAYTGLSDRALIERLNTDYAMQFFCNLYLQPHQRIESYKIVSKIRVELAYRLDWDAFQAVLAKHWLPFLRHPHLMMVDATCYETQMRYPTDAKLLWECCEWVYGQMKLLCKRTKTRRPRSKFSEQKNKQLIYQRRRKKPHKLTKKRIRSLLYLLDKLLSQLEDLEVELADQVLLPQKYADRKAIIYAVLAQQQDLFESKPVKQRIVSLAKSYIRPIVRGKEIKRVEFGAKVNICQIDGINFIEHLNFEAFHEGNRLQSSIHLVRQYTGKCTHLAADRIYGTNANRKYCTNNHIVTSFVRKGRAGKLEHQRKAMQTALNKHRATRLEGSFGTQKNHYGLQRIKARTEPTEILWIFFGVHTANAVRIGKLSNQQLATSKSA